MRRNYPLSGITRIALIIIYPRSRNRTRIVECHGRASYILAVVCGGANDYYESSAWVKMSNPPPPPPHLPIVH